jgi:hypothetical protein
MSSPMSTMDERAHNSHNLRLTGDYDSIVPCEKSPRLSESPLSAHPIEEAPFRMHRRSSESSTVAKRPASSVVSSTRNLGPSTYQSSFTSFYSWGAADDNESDHVCACTECGKRLHSPTTSPLPSTLVIGDKSHKNTETSLWKRFSGMSFESSGRSHRSLKKKSKSKTASSHAAKGPTSDMDAFRNHLLQNHSNLSAPSTPQSIPEQLAETPIPTLHITELDTTTITEPDTAPSVTTTTTTTTTTKTHRSKKQAMITPDLMRMIEKGNQKRQGSLSGTKYLKKRIDEAGKLPKRSSRPVVNPLRWQE